MAKRRKMSNNEEEKPYEIHAPVTLLQDPSVENWNKAYDTHVLPKYHKNRFNFSKIIYGKPSKESELPPIYLIPRQQAGPSFKEVKLSYLPSDSKVQYCMISKGYSMQGVSSFSLGPVVKDCLVIVNGAFSKQVTIMHVEGGGKVNLARKCLWERSRKKKDKKYKIEVCEDKKSMIVNDQVVNIQQWLKEHKSEWFDEWNRWRIAVALCGKGDFHWNNN
jgi:hypothetical protein